MRVTFVLLGLTLLVGCSATGNAASGGSGSATGTGGSTGTSGASTSGVGGGSQGQGGGGVFIDAGPQPDSGPQAPAEVFGESPDTLYKLDPVTKVVTSVGAFTGCSDVIDIALDKDGNMYGTTSGGVYRIDKTTAACTLIANGSYPNSLSFVPKGTLDPNAEALVGYEGSDYVRIDTTTGLLSTVGSGVLGGFASSGDIVSVIGGGTYLTVKGSDATHDCDFSDCIVEVDPKTGALKNVIGTVGYQSVYGLAFWGGSAYGFDSSGDLFQIDLMTGMSTSIPIPNAPPGLIWYGAGSSTSAPLTPTQ